MSIEYVGFNLYIHKDRGCYYCVTLVLQFLMKYAKTRIELGYLY